MTDIIKDAQEFIDYVIGNDGCGESHAERAEEVNRSATKMLLMIQALIENHHNQFGKIQELRKVIDNYEARVQYLKDAPREYSKDAVRYGLEVAIEIMTEGE
jgi:hypothetical protein